eukprot:GILK01006531.1.p1 GENE.GILK01006531.1~~GILK01006531.1.p1  ORF type:complete len:403 (+),score=49.26 GILK01006531.1:102-1211(+)
MAVLSHLWKQMHQNHEELENIHMDLMPVLLERETKAVDAMTDTQRYKLVQECLEAQVTDMFECLNQVAKDRPAVQLVPVEPSRAVEPDAPEHDAIFLTRPPKKAKQPVTSRYVSLWEDPAVLDEVQKKMGFSLKVKPSTIKHPEAGEGLFLEGFAIPGAVLSLFPGAVYATNHLKENKSLLDQLNRSQHTISRRSGGAINANTPVPFPFDGASILDPYTRSLNNPQRHFVHGSLVNPFAFGHKVNHPPKGTTPNVMRLDFNFPSTFPKALQPFIPNSDYLPFTKKLFSLRPAVLVRSSVLIATRPIYQGEELMLGYRYNASQPETHPSWYTSVDPEQDALVAGIAPSTLTGPKTFWKRVAHWFDRKIRI